MITNTDSSHNSGLTDIGVNEMHSAVNISMSYDITSHIADKSPHTSAIRSVLAGCGAYLPSKIITNADLEKTLETNNQWIVERTGIEERRVAAADEYTSDLATNAAKDAIQNAGMEPEDIELIVLGTTTPDHTFPATATLVQKKLGIKKSIAFDIQAVCSGFVFGLTTADMYIKSGMVKNALVIGAETLTRILNKQDRSTAILFADGAGAFILQSNKTDLNLQSEFSKNVSNSNAKSNSGIIASVLHTDGSGYDLLKTSGGPSAGNGAGVILMEGQAVFRRAVEELSCIIHEALNQACMTVNKIDWFIPHQANKRIIHAAAKAIGLNEEKIIYTGNKHANTSAASVPLAFYEAYSSGKIKSGETVLFESFGAGFTWGAVLMQI